MINELKAGSQIGRRFFACPSAVTSGMPVLIGFAAAVAVDAYDANLGGTVFAFDGTFALAVAGNSTSSPNAGVAVPPGAELYATGTLDVTTNVTYNLTIDRTWGNCPFGVYEGPGTILAGVTNSAAPVRLKAGLSPGPYAQ